LRVVHDLENLTPPLSRSVLTIGNFDGVHRAHQQLLAQAGLFAANTGGPVTVLTFEPHPLTIVAPHKAPPLLSTPDEKLRLLAEAGAEITVVARSDAALLSLEAERFVRDIIRKKFQPTHIVEGPSFGFGRGRRGNAELLRRLAAEFDCEVHIVQPITLQIDEGDTMLVSSSLIRRLIAEGEVRRAALCLGRPYALIGVVVEGERRGRTLGFPTVNMGRIEQLVPRHGVYAGRAMIDSQIHAAAISIGQSPTFAGQVERVEAHLLDFDDEVYGRPVRLEFHRFLRDQHKFESATLLVEQLRADVRAVRQWDHAAEGGFSSAIETGP